MDLRPLVGMAVPSTSSPCHLGCWLGGGERGVKGSEGEIVQKEYVQGMVCGDVTTNYRKFLETGEENKIEKGELHAGTQG
jgi:hypothetical protein